MDRFLQLKNLIWYLSLFFLVLSGFAQMPIFKRYYLADLPGLGWLAQFYVTHLIHYLSATVFIGYLMYFAVDYFLGGKKGSSGPAVYLKWTAFLGLLLTGALMVIKNFSGTPFSHGMIIGLNISHLMFCMMMIAVLVLEAAAAVRSRSVS